MGMRRRSASSIRFGNVGGKHEGACDNEGRADPRATRALIAAHNVRAALRAAPHLAENGLHRSTRPVSPSDDQIVSGRYRRYARGRDQADGNVDFRDLDHFDFFDFLAKSEEQT
jgi:hypothetical protein